MMDFISLAELNKEAASLKQLSMLKIKFVQLTVAGDWDKAIVEFPLFACESELKKFIALDFLKGIPKSFVDFCKRAKASKDAVAISLNTGNQTFIEHGEIVGFAIKENPCERTGNLVSSIYPNFQGADMAVLSVKQVSNPIQFVKLIKCL